MTKPQIPIDLAIKLRNVGPGLCVRTWKQVAEELYRRGYPPAPFPPFQDASLMRAMHESKKHKGNVK